MVKKMPSRDGNELEDPGCLLRQLEDAAPVVRSVTSLYFTQMQIRRGVYSRAAFISLSAFNCAALIRGRRLFEGGVYSRKYGTIKGRCRYYGRYQLWVSYSTRLDLT